MPFPLAVIVLSSVTSLITIYISSLLQGNREKSLLKSRIALGFSEVRAKMLLDMAETFPAISVNYSFKGGSTPEPNVQEVLDGIQSADKWVETKLIMHVSSDRASKVRSALEPLQEWCNCVVQSRRDQTDKVDNPVQVITDFNRTVLIVIQEEFREIEQKVLAA